MLQSWAVRPLPRLQGKGHPCQPTQAFQLEEENRRDAAAPPWADGDRGPRKVGLSSRPLDSAFSRAATSGEGAAQRWKSLWVTEAQLSSRAKGTGVAGLWGVFLPPASPRGGRDVTR